MDKETQKKIYDKWKTLEKETEIYVRDVHKNHEYTLPNFSWEKMKEFLKYTKWVHKYCLDMLDPAEKHELQFHLENPIQCDCSNSDCAKCLLVNCKDDDCYYHPLEKKEKFKIKYNNR